MADNDKLGIQLGISVDQKSINDLGNDISKKMKPIKIKTTFEGDGKKPLKEQTDYSKAVGETLSVVRTLNKETGKYNKIRIETTDNAAKQRALDAQEKKAVSEYIRLEKQRIAVIQKRFDLEQRAMKALESKANTIQKNSMYTTDKAGSISSRAIQAGVSTTALDAARTNFSSALTGLKQGDISSYERLISAQKRLATETQKTRFVMGDITAINKNATAMANLERQIRNYLKVHGKVKSKGGALYSEATGILDSLKGGKISTSDATRQFAEVRARIKEAGLEAKTFGQSIKEAFGRYAAIGFATTGLLIIKQTIKKMITAVRELDASIVDLQVATGMSNAEAEKLLTTYSKLGKELGATTGQVAKAADAWLRQGFSIEDTNVLIKESTMLSKLGQIESAEATKYLTSAMKGYKVEVDEVSRITDRLTAVDMEAAVSAGGIAEAMSMTANSASLAGVSMDKLIGIMSTVGEVSQQDMSRVGTTFKTVFARMSNVKLNILEDEDGNDISGELNNVEQTLGRIGIALRKSPTEWNNFGSVLDQLSVKWKELSSVDQSAIAMALGGVRQKEAILTMMENYDKVLQYEKTAMESSGTALEKFNNAYLGSIEAKTNALKASFESFSRSIVTSDILKTITDIATSTLSWLDGTDKIVPTLYRVLGVATAIGIVLKRNAIAASWQALAEFGNIVSSASAATGRAGTVAGASRMAQASAALTANGAITSSNIALTTSYLKLTESELAAALAQQNMTATEIEAELVKVQSITTTNAQAGATGLYDGAMTGLIAKLKQATVAMLKFLATNPVGWAILAVGAVASLATIFDLLTVSVDEASKKLKESSQSLSESKSKLDELESKLSNTVSRLSELKKLANDGELTLVQQTEFDLLQKTNEELQRKIDLQKLANRDAQNEANKSAMKLSKSMDKTTGTEYGDYGKKSFGMRLVEAYGDAPSAQYSANEFVDVALEKMKGLDPEKQKYKDYLSEINLLMENYQSIVDNLVPSTKEETDALENANFQLDKMSYAFGDATVRVNLFEKYSKKFGDNISGLKDYLVSIGFSSDEVSRMYLDSLLVSAKNAVDEFSELEISAKELKTSLDTLSETEGLLSSISKEIEDSGNIGMANITKMIEGYPELTDVLARYLAGVSSAKDVYGELERIYKQDYNSSVDLLAKKLDTDVEYYNKLISNGNEYLKKLAETYNINLKDFTNLANLKIAVETQMLNALGFSWSRYYNAQTRQYTDYYTKLLNSVSSSYRGENPALNQQLKEAFAVRDALNKLREESYSPITTSSIGAGNISSSLSTGSGSTSKKEEPKAKTAEELLEEEKKRQREAFEAQKAIIDRQLALNLITEEQYTNSLEALYKQFYSDKSKYLAEYTQYEIEVYNKRQSFLEQAQKDLESLHKATMDMIKKEKEEEKDALEKKKDGLKEYTDARKKALQDARDQDSHDKKIREKSTDIESIKAQLMGLSGDMSGAGMRKKTELTQRLKEAQDELSEAVADRQYEMQVEALDASYEAQEKNIDAQIEGIDAFLNNQNTLVKASFDRMNGMSATLKSQLIAYNKEYGDGIANDIVKNWDAATEALKKYGSAANVETTLGVITTNIGRASSQVPTGYANGTSGLKRDSIIVGTHELLLNKTGSNAYQMMNAGSPIFTEQQTNALKALLSSPNSLLTKTVGGVGLKNASTIMSMVNSNNSPSIEINYEMNISGTDPQGIKLALEKEMPKFSDYVLNKINKDVQFNKGVRLTAANMT